MQFEAGVQSSETAMANNIRHRLQGPLVLIAGRNSMAAGIGAVLLLGKENRHLCAKLRQLKGAYRPSRQPLIPKQLPAAAIRAHVLTGDDCYARAGRGSSCADGRDGPEVGIGALLAQMPHDVDATIPLEPVGVGIFGPLVDGEGNGSDERYACHRGRHA